MEEQFSFAANTRELLMITLYSQYTDGIPVSGMLRYCSPAAAKRYCKRINRLLRQTCHVYYVHYQLLKKSDLKTLKYYNYITIEKTQVTIRAKDGHQHPDYAHIIDRLYYEPLKMQAAS